MPPPGLLRSLRGCLLGVTHPRVSWKKASEARRVALADDSWNLWTIWHCERIIGAWKKCVFAGWKCGKNKTDRWLDCLFFRVENFDWKCLNNSNVLWIFFYCKDEIWIIYNITVCEKCFIIFVFHASSCFITRRNWKYWKKSLLKFSLAKNCCLGICYIHTNIFFNCKRWKMFDMIGWFIYLNWTVSKERHENNTQRLSKAYISFRYKTWIMHGVFIIIFLYVLRIFSLCEKSLWCFRYRKKGDLSDAENALLI